jgi:hypothetical protein
VVDHALASSLRERVRPVSLAGERVLAAQGPLAAVLPDGGLRRGTTVAVDGVATSLALALAASVATTEGWVAVTGLGRLGLAAAEEFGVPLERLLLVDPVPAASWDAVVAALVEAVDVVLVGAPPAPVAPSRARRVVARLRERGSVLLQVGWPERAWPERAELCLRGRSLGWTGIGEGHGHLQGRRVEITVGGRHGADRGRRALFWLPDDRGRVAPVEPGPPEAGRPVPGPDRPQLSLVPS